MDADPGSLRVTGGMAASLGLSHEGDSVRSSEQKRIGGSAGGRNRTDGRSTLY